MSKLSRYITPLSSPNSMPVKLPGTFPHFVQTTHATDLTRRLDALGQEESGQKILEHLTKVRSRTDTRGISPDADSGMSSQS